VAGVHKAPITANEDRAAREKEVNIDAFLTWRDLIVGLCSLMLDGVIRKQVYVDRASYAN
jgi:hypothetical protein